MYNLLEGLLRFNYIQTHGATIGIHDIEFTLQIQDWNHSLPTCPLTPPSWGHLKILKADLLVMIGEGEMLLASSA